MSHAWCWPQEFGQPEMFMEMPATASSPVSVRRFVMASPSPREAVRARLQVSAPGQEVPEDVILREGGQDMDQAVPLFSDYTEGLVEADFDRDGRASWISEDPLPATVTLAVLNIDVSWRDE